MLGGQGKRKDRKTWKRRSEEKVVGFSSASLFPARKWEAVTQKGREYVGECAGSHSVGKLWKKQIDTMKEC